MRIPFIIMFLDGLTLLGRGRGRKPCPGKAVLLGMAFHGRPHPVEKRFQVYRNLQDFIRSCDWATNSTELNGEFRVTL